MERTIKKGILAIVVLAATVAFMGVLARYLSDGFTILQQVYLRIFIALVFALIVFRKQIRWQVIRSLSARQWWIVAFRGTMAYTVGVALMSWAATLTTISNVTFIAALPVVPLFGFLLLKEKVTWWKLLFIAGSIGGVVLLAAHPSNIMQWGKGEIVAVGATFGIALGYIARKWHDHALNNQEITLLTFIFGCAVSCILSFAVGEGVPSFDVPWGIWVALFIGGSISLVKLFLTNYGFQYLDAVRAGNLLTLEGAWGILFGFIFYREVPTWHGLLGGAIIVACVVGMNHFSKRFEHRLVAAPEGTFADHPRR